MKKKIDPEKTERFVEELQKIDFPVCIQWKDMSGSMKIFENGNYIRWDRTVAGISFVFGNKMFRKDSDHVRQMFYDEVLMLKNIHNEISYEQFNKELQEVEDGLRLFCKNVDQAYPESINVKSF